MDLNSCRAVISESLQTYVADKHKSTRLTIHNKSGQGEVTPIESGRHLALEQSLEVLPTDLRERISCPICRLLLFQPKRGPCGHVFCGECISRWLGRQPGEGSRCPMCRCALDISDLVADTQTEQLCVSAVGADLYAYRMSSIVETRLSVVLSAQEAKTVALQRHKEVSVAQSLRDGMNFGARALILGSALAGIRGLAAGGLATACYSAAQLVEHNKLEDPRNFGLLRVDDCLKTDFWRDCGIQKVSCKDTHADSSGSGEVVLPKEGVKIRKYETSRSRPSQPSTPDTSSSQGFLTYRDHAVVASHSFCLVNVSHSEVFFEVSVILSENATNEGFDLGGGVWRPLTQSLVHETAKSEVVVWVSPYVPPDHCVEFALAGSLCAWVVTRAFRRSGAMVKKVCGATAGLGKPSTIVMLFVETDGLICQEKPFEGGFSCNPPPPITQETSKKPSESISKTEIGFRNSDMFRVVFKIEVNCYGLESLVGRLGISSGNIYILGDTASSTVDVPCPENVTSVDVCIYAVPYLEFNRNKATRSLPAFVEVNRYQLKPGFEYVLAQPRALLPVFSAIAHAELDAFGTEGTPLDPPTTIDGQGSGDTEGVALEGQGGNGE